jgi:hypothetical protein
VPKIRWSALPARVKAHLLDRVRIREIDARDMATLLAWINTDPELPAGAWCRDFGAFKLVGEGAIPKTFLRDDQPCVGERV